MGKALNALASMRVSFAALKGLYLAQDLFHGLLAEFPLLRLQVCDSLLAKQAHESRLCLILGKGSCRGETGLSEQKDKQKAAADASTSAELAASQPYKQ